MISKELLSEVFKENVISIDGTIGNNLTFTSFDNMWSGEYTKHVINIHELAHKCKEWALSKNVSIESGLPYKTRATSAVFDSNEGFLEGFEAETEPMAIFQACQWILEQKNIHA
jgi:hypothetical protein